MRWLVQETATSYTPLCSVAQLQAGPLNDLIRTLSAAEQLNLVTRASRAVEAQCGRRLVPFSGVTESHRAQAIDPDEGTDVYTPLDQTAMLGMSRAASLGSSQLVRHFWLSEYPPLWSDLWTGSISQIQIFRAISGSETITDSTTWQYETDTGHVRVSLGTYLPQGSTIVTTYSGGYSTIPDDLVMACELKAAVLQMVSLEPEARPGVDMTEIVKQINLLLKPYTREVDPQ